MIQTSVILSSRATVLLLPLMYLQLLEPSRIIQCVSPPSLDSPAVLQSHTLSISCCTGFHIHCAASLICEIGVANNWYSERHSIFGVSFSTAPCRLTRSFFSTRSSGFLTNRTRSGMQCFLGRMMKRPPFCQGWLKCDKMLIKQISHTFISE